MTNSPFIALDRVSFQFANGHSLFEALSETFDNRHTGLVGRNGAGKSLLGRLLAGIEQPTAGHISRQARVAHLAQTLELTMETRTVDLMGFGAPYDALLRVMAGEPHEDDIEKLDGRWDIIERLRSALVEDELGHLALDGPAVALSGGERTRVALLGVLLTDADLLILDEPSNHLDSLSRQRLRERLLRWPGGLVLISHDRELLAGMQRIVELSPQGLHAYGGGYAFYRDCRQREEQAAIQALEHARITRKRTEQELQTQQQRQQRRAASGTRNARDSNQAQILLGRQKSRSENSAGRLQSHAQDRREQLHDAVRAAADKVNEQTIITLHGSDLALSASKQVLTLRDACLPRSGFRMPDMQLFGSFRLAISGANGCGKSTVLAMIAGLLEPASGECRVDVAHAYLDQHLSGLDRDGDALDHLRRCAPGLSEPMARTRLAHIGLNTDKVSLPCSQLSGGERLKLALAGVIAAEPAKPLLLLDEPDNHIDLDSLLAVETMLRHYQGALVVVSHDEAFIEALKPTDRLRWTHHQWRHERLSP